MYSSRTPTLSLLIVSAVILAGCASSDPVLPTLAVLPSVTPTLSDVELKATSEQMTATYLPTATDAPSATPAPTVTPVPTATALFHEDEYVRVLTDSVFLLAGGRNVSGIRVADGRDAGGERVIILAYSTRETTESGFVDEWLDLLSAVAASIIANDLDVDAVSLVAGTTTGQAAGILSVSSTDLLSWYKGEIGRADLFERITMTTLMDQVSPEVVRVQPPAVWTLASAAAPTRSAGQTARQWSCAGDLYNCRDFSSRTEMESYIAACPGDPSDLDGDEDGAYCE